MQRKRAIALWRLATMLRMNQDSELHVLANGIDRRARVYALEAGIDYGDVANEVEGNSEYDESDISAIMD